MASTSRRLLLHIGHTKTGSSYIQSSLELSREALREQGVFYPMPPKGEAEAARSGRTTSGNGGYFAGRAPSPEMPRGFSGDVLFSSEVLFDHVDWDRLQTFRTAQGFTEMKVLLFTRDPVEHLESHWQQLVKRANETRGLESALAGYDTPKLARAWIERIEAMPDTTIRVLNYARHRGDVLGAVADWAGIDRSLLASPPVGNVNRSLTRAELEFQRLFNGFIEDHGRLVSDRLVDGLPEIPAERAAVDPRTARRIIEAVRSDLEWINARIAPEEAYALSPNEAAPGGDADADRYCFNHDQLSVLAESFATEIGDLRAKAQAAKQSGLRGLVRRIKKGLRR